MAIKTESSEKQTDSSLKRGESLQEILSEEYCNFGGTEFILLGIRMSKRKRARLSQPTVLKVKK